MLFYTTPLLRDRILQHGIDSAEALHAKGKFSSWDHTLEFL